MHALALSNETGSRDRIALTVSASNGMKRHFRTVIRVGGKNRTAGLRVGRSVINSMGSERAVSVGVHVTPTAAAARSRFRTGSLQLKATSIRSAKHSDTVVIYSHAGKEATDLPMYPYF
jgi:hypothetical protein